MRVVLARRSDSATADGQPPSVHAFRVDESDPPAVVWHAACGMWAKPDEVEVVEQFTGAPCAACVLVAAMDGPSAEPPALEAPDADTDDGGRFAISWRERELHRVADDAARTVLDGRQLVQGHCGGLGWGPVAEPPHGWPVCSECAEIVASGR